MGKTLLEQLTASLLEARAPYTGAQYELRRRTDWALINVLANLEARVSRLEEDKRVGR